MFDVVCGSRYELDRWYIDLDQEGGECHTRSKNNIYNGLNC
jgi:hypothetical protein